MVLRCRVHAWAYVGTAKVASKLKPGTTVRAMVYSQAIQYADFILRKAGEVPAGLALSWVSRNEALTRSRTVNYQLGGYPPCEALEVATQETVEWSLLPSESGQVTSSSASECLENSLCTTLTAQGSRSKPHGGAGASASGPRTPPGADRHPSGKGGGRTRTVTQPSDQDSKKQRRCTTLPGGRKVCKPFNDERGCDSATTGKSCLGGFHLCDRILPSTSKACGEAHARKGCTRA